MSTTNNSNEMAMKQHTHLINLVRGMVPPLTSKLHKGQAGTSYMSCGVEGTDRIGRIGVLGGSGE
jgi:hypothetical protein